MGNVSALKIVEDVEPGAIVEFNVTEAVLAEIKGYEVLEITDGKSEAVAKKARQVVRTMRTDIDKRRKELKAPLLAHGKLIDQTAKELTERLLPTEQNLDGKIKAVEAVAEAAKAERMAIEKTRIDGIMSKITEIEDITSAAQKYGLTSADIMEKLGELENYPVNVLEFEEFTENVLISKSKQIEIVKATLERTVKFEADQQALNAVAESNKAEADRLAVIAKDQEEAAKKSEAEIYAKMEAERATIKAEKAELQAEKDRIAQAEAEKAEKEAAETQYIQDRDDAHELNLQIALGEVQAMVMESAWIEEAYQINAKIDAERLILRNLKHSQAKIEKARLEALIPDKQKLMEYSNSISKFTGEMNTDQGKSMAFWVNSMIDGLRADLVIRIESI